MRRLNVEMQRFVIDKPCNNSSGPWLSLHFHRHQRIQQHRLELDRYLLMAEPKIREVIFDWFNQMITL